MEENIKIDKKLIKRPNKINAILSIFYGGMAIMLGICLAFSVEEYDMYEVGLYSSMTSFLFSFGNIMYLKSILTITENGKNVSIIKKYVNLPVDITKIYLSKIKSYVKYNAVIIGILCSFVIVISACTSRILLFIPIMICITGILIAGIIGAITIWIDLENLKE